MTTRSARRQAREKVRKPLYPRLLRLRHIEPNAWQRAVLGEGAIGAGVLLAMADVASAWSIVVLPVAVAVVVKAHDALQGLLEKPPAQARPRRTAGKRRGKADGARTRRRSQGDKAGARRRSNADGAGPRRGRRRRRRSGG